MIALSNDADQEATSTRSLTSTVYRRLRQDIIRGILTPNLKLKIHDLCERYAIGTTPMREALTLLTTDGLVERVDQRGFRVAQVSAGDFEQILMTRCWLEERALRESIARGGRDWESAVVLAKYYLVRAARPTSVEGPELNQEWEQHHRKFHMALIAACPSRILLRYCEQLYDENNRYRNLARIAPGSRDGAYQEHENIADAVLARDADTAVQRLLHHYHRTGELLRAYLAGDELSPA